MTIAALGDLGAMTCIPLDIRAVIDRPVARPEHGGLAALTGLALGLGEGLLLWAVPAGPGQRRHRHGANHPQRPLCPPPAPASLVPRRAGTTALVVVHRPSTLALADRLAFLAGGRVAATGSHHDLLESVPAYRAVLAQEADETGPLPEAEVVA